MAWKYQPVGGQLVLKGDAAQSDAQREAGRAGHAKRREIKALKALRDGQPVRTMKALEKRIYAIETGADTWAKPLIDKVRALNARWPNKRPVTFEQYQTAIKDPWFSQQVEEAWKAQARGALPQVIEASIQVASKPTKEGFQDRKLLLGLTGVYNEALEVKAEVGVVHEVGDKLAAALQRAEASRQSALARRRGDDPLVIDGEAETIQDHEETAQAARAAAAKRSSRRAKAAQQANQDRAKAALSEDERRAEEAQAAAERMVEGVVAPDGANADMPW